MALNLWSFVNPFNGTDYESHAEALLFALFVIVLATAGWRRLKDAGFIASVGRLSRAAMESVRRSVEWDQSVLRAIRNRPPLPRSLALLGSVLCLVLSVASVFMCVAVGTLMLDVQVIPLMPWWGWMLGVAYCAYGVVQSMMFLASATKLYSHARG